jgi:serine protease Do
MKRLNYLIFLTLSLGLCCTKTFAQEEKGTAKINVTVTKDGETKNITKEIDLDDIDQVQSILKEFEGLENVDIDIDGSQVKVMVRKDGGESDVNFLNFSGENCDVNKMLELKSSTYLGVKVENAEGGVKVLKVLENTSAEKAGLLDGDIITEFDGNSISDYKGFTEAIKAKSTGDKVNIKVKRGGKTKKLKAELGERKVKMYKMASFNGEGVNWNDIKDMDFDVKVFSSGDFKDKGYAGFSYSKGEDLEILKVMEDTPAEQAGLKAGDKLKSIDGINLLESSDVSKVFADKKPGDKVIIGIERDGATLDKEVVLVERKGFTWAKNLNIDENVFENGTKRISIVVKSYSLDKEEEEILGKALKMKLGEESSALSANTNVFPNPSKGDFNINFEIEEEGDTEVLVLDNTGKQVYKLTLDNFSGKYSGNVDISNQPVGNYFLVIKQGDRAHTEKLIKN